jgi:hypothetical protein
LLTSLAGVLRYFLGTVIGNFALSHATVTVATNNFECQAAAEQLVYNLWDFGTELNAMGFISFDPLLVTQAPLKTATVHSESYMRGVLAHARLVSRQRGEAARDTWCSGEVSLDVLRFSSEYMTSIFSMYPDVDDAPVARIVELSNFARAKAIDFSVESGWGTETEDARDNAEPGPAWCASLFYRVLAVRPLGVSFAFPNHVLGGAVHELLTDWLGPGRVEVAPSSDGIVDGVAVATAPVAAPPVPAV